MNKYFLLGILTVVFVKGCILPGWSSAVEFALACALVGFLAYFAPNEDNRKVVQRFEAMELKLAALQENLSTLRLKIGIRG